MSTIQKKAQSLIKDVEYQISLRTDKLSEKQQIRFNLSNLFDKANSSKHFFELLKEHGYDTYKRNGLIVGIKINRKYRFSTLGYPLDKILSLDKEQIKNKRLNQIKKVAVKKQQDQHRER